MTGEIAAASEQAVLIELESRKLTPVAIRAGAVKRGNRWRMRRVSVRKLGETYGQLADLLHAGVPLLRALKLLAGRKSQPALGMVFRELAEAVEKGSDLATVMEEKPEAFPDVHVAMVRAGEKGGFLEKVLGRLSAVVIAQAEMRSKLIGNLVYPTVLAVMGVAVGLVIFGVLVPKFRSVFSRMPELPTVTKMVFAVSDAVGKYGVLSAVVLAAACAGVWFGLKRPAMKERIARVLLRAPVVGQVNRTLATARFCQLLGAMLANGVPMLAALQIAKKGAGNVVLERAVEKSAEAVRSGQQLAPPLAESGLFDDDVVEMIAVGEAANNLDEVLLKISATLEGRLDRQLSVAVKLVEPLLLVVLGGVIFFVAVGLLTPMAQMGATR